MCTLSSRVGDDVHRSVGDEDHAVDRRHVHDEAVTDASAGAQSGLALHHRGHDLVGVQAPLHQHLGLAFACQANGGFGRRHAVRRIDDFEGGDVDPELGRDRRDARAGPDQDRTDQAQLRGFDGAAQRALVAGMRHGAGRRRQPLAAGDQGIVLFVLSFGHGCSYLCAVAASGRGMETSSASRFRKHRRRRRQPPGCLARSVRARRGAAGWRGRRGSGSALGSSGRAFVQMKIQVSGVSSHHAAVVRRSFVPRQRPPTRAARRTR